MQRIRDLGTTTPHIIPYSSDIEASFTEQQHVIYHRHPKCKILAKFDGLCNICQKSNIDNKQKLERKLKNSKIPAKKFAPTSVTDPKRIILAPEQNCDGLQFEIDRLRAEINDKGVRHHV